MKDKELCYEKNYAILKNLLNISNIYVNVTLTGLTGLNKLQYLTTYIIQLYPTRFINHYDKWNIFWS